MKKDLTTQIMGYYLRQIGCPKLSYACRKAIFIEYEQILSSAKEIGKNNPLISAYALGAWFIAMNRKDDLSPAENCEILIEELRKSRLFHLVMEDADHYLAPKRMEERKTWAKATHERTYENDWVVDLLPGNGTYDLG